MKEGNINRGQSRFLSNTAALVSQTIVGTILALVQVKILSNSLSQGTFGLFVSLRGLSLLLALLGANGLPLLLVRYLPVHETTGARARAISLSISCFAASTVVLAVLLVVFYVLRGRLLAFAGGTLTSDVTIWFAVATTGIMLKQVVYGGLQGLRRMTAQVPIELGSLVAVLIWIYVTRDELTVASLFKILGVVQALSFAIALPVFGLMLRRLSPNADAQGNHGTSLLAYRSYLVGATGISLVALAFTDVDRYVIAQVLSLELIALFHIAARISRAANRVLAAPNTAIQPEVTRLYAAGRLNEIESITRLFLKANVALGMIVAFTIGIFARDLVLALSAVEYAGATQLLVLLALCVPLTTATAPLTTVMRASDQVGSALRIDLVWAVLYVVLALVFGSLFDLTGIGFAHIVACLAQLAFAVRLSGLSLDLRFVAGVMGRILSGALLSMLPLLVAARVPGDVSVAKIGLEVLLFVAGIAVYPRCLKLVGLLAEPERAELRSVLQRRRLGLLVRWLCA